MNAGLVDKAEILKKPVGGIPIAGAGNPLPGIGMLGTVQLKKVERPEEKKSVSGPAGAGAAHTQEKPSVNVNPAPATAEKTQNLAHLSNIMVQGAINRKSKPFEAWIYIGFW